MLEHYTLSECAFEHQRCGRIPSHPQQRNLVFCMGTNSWLNSLTYYTCNYSTHAMAPVTRLTILYVRTYIYYHEQKTEVRHFVLDTCLPHSCVYPDYTTKFTLPSANLAQGPISIDTKHCEQWIHCNVHTLHIRTCTHAQLKRPCLSAWWAGPWSVHCHQQKIRVFVSFSSQWLT